MKRIEWVLNGAFVWVSSLFLYIASPWGLLGYPFRYACLICPLVATILSWQKARRLPAWSGGWKLGCLAPAVSGAAVLLTLALRGQRPDHPAVDLLFPLQHGTYVIGQGGSTRIVNAHRAVRSHGFLSETIWSGVSDPHFVLVSPAALSAFATWATRFP